MYVHTCTPSLFPSPSVCGPSLESWREREKGGVTPNWEIVVIEIHTWRHFSTDWAQYHVTRQYYVSLQYHVTTWQITWPHTLPEEAQRSCPLDSRILRYLEGLATFQVRILNYLLRLLLFLVCVHCLSPFLFLQLLLVYSVLCKGCATRGKPL